MKRTLLIFGTLVLSLLFSNTAFSQAGTLDTTFGSGGKVTTFTGIPGAPGNNLVNDSVLQSDGKIILAGNSNSYADGSAFLLARYLPNGALDTTFGTGGYVTTLVGNHCTGQSVSLQTDGKIVVAGSTYIPSQLGVRSDIMIVRYNENGSLDTTFDTDGIKVETVDYSQFVNALLIQADGKMVVGGTFESIDKPGYNTFGLARFNTNGSLDQTYGVNGFVFTPNLSGGEILDMKFTDNESIIAVGRNNYGLDCVVGKYNANGEIVKSFGSNGTGLIEEDFGKIALLYKCVISKNNDIYIGGASFDGVKYSAFISKYNASGIADNSFGVKGKILRDFGTNIASFANDITIDHNNNLLVGYGVGLTSDYNFGIESYSLSGVLNTSFGTNGYFTTNFGSGHDYFETMLVQPDNKIVMAGNKGSFVMTRINNTKVLSTIDFAKTANEINISPNPVNDYPTLSLELKESADLSVDLYDTKGVLVSNLVKNKNYNEGSNIEQLDLSNINLSKGIYFLKINGNGKAAKTIKIIK
ncbi:T9SS type A sorting domain-containing protein [Flavobacterium sp. ANB]|uniref:T9SS type A sorting domain-containing protein n=1 Tax=unclassified Flavobacterium TaxID=196869 RepID=UPI0012B8B3E5|nr:MULTISPECIES: T9SS type A sorting domain-containing protein [unclassified Flavobacterium]MBF4517862.1 T9SS type A sorting domain-containing protein [Flavobacterium sp. ANB]MTD72068.1 T9SS type A sorting domain-containing protein [Flavobacterium sp. LC2016-13]